MLPVVTSTSSSTPPSTMSPIPTATDSKKELDNVKEPSNRVPSQVPDVIPTDPPPPPPKKLRLWHVPVAMLLAAVIFWRLWFWIGPHFGR